VVRGGIELTPRSILDHLEKSGLPRYEMPEFILPLAEMPLTASGKLLKRALVQWVAEGRAQPVSVRLLSRAATPD
jgi:acyl-CoA synthetase